MNGFFYLFITRQVCSIDFVQHVFALLCGLVSHAPIQQQVILHRIVGNLAARLHRNGTPPYAAAALRFICAGAASVGVAAAA